MPFYQSIENTIENIEWKEKIFRDVEKDIYSFCLEGEENIYEDLAQKTCFQAIKIRILYGVFCVWGLRLYYCTLWGYNTILPNQYFLIKCRFENR